MILYSPSQIKTFRACTRKWALEKILGLRGPETKSQTLGKEVDDNNLQPYLRDGKPIDESTEAGKIAASGLAWLPQPKWRGLEVQKHFIFVSPSKMGFGYQGYKDLWLPYGGQPGFDDELPVVADFKTTKSFKWALKEDALWKDEQNVIYAVNGLLETKSNVIHSSWLYMQTEGAKKALPTQITMTSKDVAEQFRIIEEDTKRMHVLRSAAPADWETNKEAAKAYALSLTPNRDACGDYGGCPHQHLCFKLEDLMDEPSVVKESKEEKLMPEIDLMAKLKKKATASGADVQAAPAAPVAGDAVQAQAVAAPTPPTQEQIAAEPALGINPTLAEGTPQAPPVGSVEAKPRRGRPAGAKNKPAEQVSVEGHTHTEEPGFSVTIDEATYDPFFAAWGKLGVALKGFIDAAVASVRK